MAMRTTRLKLFSSSESDFEDVLGILSESLVPIMKRSGKSYDPSSHAREFVLNLDLPPGGSRENLKNMMIADENSVVIGFVGVYFGYPNKFVGQIVNLYLTSSCRRKGYGREVVEFVERLFVDKGITKSRVRVESENIGGMKFWTSMGYSTIVKIDSEGNEAGYGIGLSKDLAGVN